MELYKNESLHLVNIYNINLLLSYITATHSVYWDVYLKYITLICNSVFNNCLEINNEIIFHRPCLIHK